MKLIGDLSAQWMCAFMCGNPMSMLMGELS